MGDHRHEERASLRSRIGRRSPKDSDRDELTDINVGNNRFHAQLIAEACGAASLKVKLLLSDDSGYGNVEAHRLLLFARDLEQVAAIIEKTDSENST